MKVETLISCSDCKNFENKYFFYGLKIGFCKIDGDLAIKNAEKCEKFEDARMFDCHHCEEKFPIKELINNNGKFYCRKCVDSFQKINLTNRSDF